MDQDNGFLKSSLKRMLVAQEVLAKYRFNDPEVSEFHAAVASASFRWNKAKLGYLLTKE